MLYTYKNQQNLHGINLLCSNIASAHEYIKEH